MNNSNDVIPFILYTDGGGGTKHSNFIGGWGVVLILSDGTKKYLYGYEDKTTNNKMELSAAINGILCVMDYVEAHQIGKYEIKVVTDSQYLQKGVTEWLDLWINNKWRNSQKKPVMNKDLWVILNTLRKKNKLVFEWTRGHNGDENNEIADKLCTHIIQKRKKELGL